MNGIYTCKKCGDDNLLMDEMRITDWSSSTCLKCYNKQRREYRQNHQEKFKQYDRNRKLKSRNTFLIKKYGISLEKYNELLKLHQGGCAICRQPPKAGTGLAVDHNHETKQVRGLLCHNCNLAIALLNEDEDLFSNAIEYLKRYSKIKIA